MRHNFPKYSLHVFVKKLISLKIVWFWKYEGYQGLKQMKMSSFLHFQIVHINVEHRTKLLTLIRFFFQFSKSTRCFSTSFFTSSSISALKMYFLHQSPWLSRSNRKMLEIKYIYWFPDEKWYFYFKKFGKNYTITIILNLQNHWRQRDKVAIANFCADYCLFSSFHTQLVTCSL